jgi:hypothetical protein
MGTLVGLVIDPLFMWWYWPSAHAYMVEPLAISLWSSALLCDLIYPFVLRQVRASERMLPDGRLVSATHARGPMFFGQDVASGPVSPEEKKER